MKVIVVDIQGFTLGTGENREFYPKELSIQEGYDRRASHYLIKPPRSFTSLSEEDKKQVRFMERNIHGLLYSSGYIEYSVLKEIIKDHLIGANLIYVRGFQKFDYISKVLQESFVDNNITITSDQRPIVVNVENFDNFTCNQPPLYKVEVPYCVHHMNPKRAYRCSKKNSLDLFTWVYNLLPQ